MKCYYHPESDSAKACSSCRKLLCSSCSHTIKGTIYCQDCLVAGAELAALAASPRLSNYSPARAGLFGVVPGLGAVYNGQYVKAVIHFSVFASLVILGGEIGIFVVGAISFYIFMLVDAYRSAQVIVRRWVAQPEIMEEESEETSLLLWGGILILMGFIFFLANLGVFDLEEIVGVTLPLIFVAGGIYLVLDHYLGGKGSTSSRRAAPGAATEQPGVPTPEFEPEDHH